MDVRQQTWTAAIEYIVARKVLEETLGYIKASTGCLLSCVELNKKIDEFVTLSVPYLSDAIIVHTNDSSSHKGRSGVAIEVLKNIDLYINNRINQQDTLIYAASAEPQHNFQHINSDVLKTDAVKSGIFIPLKWGNDYFGWVGFVNFLKFSSKNFTNYDLAAMEEVTILLSTACKLNK